MIPMGATPSTGTQTKINFRTGYMDGALFDLERVLDESVRKLTVGHFDGDECPDFDTIVGTGLSGAVVIPALALRLGVNYALVRKESDNSHHKGRMVGAVGQRWLFVDDFMASGRTRSRVIRAVRECVKQENEDWEWKADHVPHQTTYVGSYFYRTEYYIPAHQFDEFDHA